MDEEDYRVKAAQLALRAQTEHDAALRAAMIDLARDYSRLAQGAGSEPALSVDFELPSQSD